MGKPVNSGLKINPEELEEGLTWRSILALVYGALVMFPIVLYSTIFAGASMSAPAIYLTVLLFTEFARLARSPLKSQETFLIYKTVAIAATTSPFLDLLYRGYYVSGPTAMAFSEPITGLPLPYVVPRWWAPPIHSEVYALRTFLHLDWLQPVTILALYAIFVLLVESALGIIGAQLFVLTERLPFPIAQVDAVTVVTLTERPPERMRILTLSALLGMIWGFLVYGFPLVSSAIWGISATLIPVPWIDLNVYIERVLPGASFGFYTDLLAATWGWLLPFNVVVWMFIGSLVTYFLGNAIALKLPDAFPEWVREWTPGTPMMLAYQRSYLWVWVSPMIGFTLGASVIMIFRSRRAFALTFKALSRIEARQIGLLPLPLVLILFLTGTLGGIAVFQLLVPGFPFYLSILTIPLTLLIGIINSRSWGLGTGTITIPYIWNGIVMASGYMGVEPWFVNPVLAGGGADIWWNAGIFSNAVAGSYIVKMKPLSYLKAVLIGIPLAWMSSFVFSELFWRIAPIPSSAYPYTLITWPVNVISGALWVTRQLSVFKPLHILGGFVAFTGVSTLLMALKVPGFEPVGLIMGLTSLPPLPATYIIFALIGRYILAKRLGAERWRTMSLTITAGIGIGEGVVIGVAVAIAMIGKSMWVLPY